MWNQCNGEVFHSRYTGVQCCAMALANIMTINFYLIILPSYVIHDIWFQKYAAAAASYLPADLLFTVVGVDLASEVVICVICFLVCSSFIVYVFPTP